MATWGHAPLFLSLSCTALLWPQTAKLRPETAPVEDSRLRAEAVRLLERANAVSTPAWRANETIIGFHLLDSALGTPADGELRISVAAPLVRRSEVAYGSYRYTEVYNLGQAAVARSEPAEPAVITHVRDLVPITLVNFDREDIIRSIDDATVDGRRARCIEFDSLSGDRQQSGQACTDSQEGWLLSLRQGNTTIRQSAFFRFGDAWLPGRIERLTGETPKLVITQIVQIRSEYPSGQFAFPDNATVRPICREYRRAYAINTPQPRAATNSTDVVDIRVHGNIGENGRPTGVTAVDTARPELAAEAVRVVSSWSFQPAVCDGSPTIADAEFTVHFRGR